MMTRHVARTLLLSLLFATGTNAYAPTMTTRRAPFFVTVVETQNPQATKMESSSSPEMSGSPQSPQKHETSKAAAPKNSVKTKKPADVAGHGKTGPFAPLVLLTKDVMGEDELNKLRAKAIGLHSDVIAKFVETAETDFGQQALKLLFSLADQDKNGMIDEEELKTAMRALGFVHLKEKQIGGILQRADMDANGALDFNEWRLEAPKTLRTNLIKLAKKNGGELGFLA